ncbi:MAG: hypothetical protein ACJAQT_001402 [Akkermansiaceae bacterium]|jgi:hypothetical protein
MVWLELQPLVLSLYLADLDLDGKDDLLLPNIGTTPPVPDAKLARNLAPHFSDDQQTPAFPHRKDRNDHSLFYDFKSSDDLIFWNHLSLSNSTANDLGTTWEQVTIPLSTQPLKKFYRLSASHDPGR